MEHPQPRTVKPCGRGKPRLSLEKGAACHAWYARLILTYLKATQAEPFWSSRVRKGKCDGSLPICVQCQTRGIECVYDPRPNQRGPDKIPGARNRLPNGFRKARSHARDPQGNQASGSNSRPGSQDTALAVTTRKFHSAKGDIVTQNAVRPFLFVNSLSEQHAPVVVFRNCEFPFKR